MHIPPAARCRRRWFYASILGPCPPGRFIRLTGPDRRNRVRAGLRDAGSRSAAPCPSAQVASPLIFSRKKVRVSPFYGLTRTSDYCGEILTEPALLLSMTAAAVLMAASAAGTVGAAAPRRTANTFGAAPLGLDDVPGGCQHHGSNDRCKDDIRHNYNLLSKARLTSPRRSGRIPPPGSGSSVGPGTPARRQRCTRPQGRGQTRRPDCRW